MKENLKPCIGTAPAGSQQLQGPPPDMSTVTIRADKMLEADGFQGYLGYSCLTEQDSGMVQRFPSLLWMPLFYGS